MAVPSYTEDLTDIELAVTAWPELTGATAGLASAFETDWFLEGTTCVSKPFATAGLGSMAYVNASPISIPSGSATFHWVFFGGPNAIATLASGGYRISIGNTIANYKMWYVLGSDTYAYGGWVNVAIDPTVTADASYGAPSGETTVFGSVVNLLNPIAKGNPYCNDAIRYGREMIVTAGEAANYATFVGAAAANDAVAARWGLFQAISGGYLQKGRFRMGDAATAVDFRDSNRNIFVQDTTKVTANFNEYEVRNALSRVDWTGINITALGTTSKGRLVITDNADINFDTCTFTDMNTFGFLANSTILATTFRRCGIVTQGGAVFTNCKFDNATGTRALVVSAVANVTNTEFVSDGTGYALEGFSTAGDYSLTNLTFTGYAASNGSTGNEAIHVLATTGIVNLNRSGGGGIASVHTEGATVNVIASVWLRVYVKDEANANVSGASVAIYKSSDMTELMNELSDVNGLAEQTFNYPGSDVGIIARVRKSSTGTRYFPLSTTGTILSGGYTLTAVMIADGIVA